MSSCPMMHEFFYTVVSATMFPAMNIYGLRRMLDSVSAR